jgi:hypothetical protein
MATKPKYVHAGASISKCGQFRYLLWREWRGTHDPKNWTWWGGVDGKGDPLGEPKPLVFVMLNPSTADGTLDDPTIRRCVGFAKAWKYERLEVVNLYAYRATFPTELLRRQNRHEEIIGPDNIDHVRKAGAGAGKVICAWGAHVEDLGVDHCDTVRGWMGDPKCFHLGLTKNGQPKHPLRLAGATIPQVLP